MLKLITSSPVLYSSYVMPPYTISSHFMRPFTNLLARWTKSVYGNGEKALFPFRPSMNVLDCKGHDQNSRQLGDASTTVSERQLE